MIARILVIRIEIVMETMKLVWDDDGNIEILIQTLVVDRHKEIAKGPRDPKRP